ncbi:hypothetical protein VTH06DRAFT_2853 [Thermothelomyces fergusii]
MSVRNTTMNVDQLRGLVASHKHTVREFDFKNLRGGRVSPGLGGGRCKPGAVRSDLGGMIFGGMNDVDVLETGVEERTGGVTAAVQRIFASKSTASAGILASTRRTKKPWSVKERAEHRRREYRSVGSRHHSGRGRHKHSGNNDISDCHSSSRDSQHRRHRCHRQHRSEEGAETAFMTGAVGADNEADQPPDPPRPKRDISVAIMNPDPLPMFDDGLSPAQRSIEADMLAEAEEAAARSAALKQAKEAIITKLSREFSKRRVDKSGPRNKDSAAVIASLSALSFRMNLPALRYGGLSCAPSSSVGHRLCDSTFERRMANVAITPDHRNLESQTALVPLIFTWS